MTSRIVCRPLVVAVGAVIGALLGSTVAGCGPRRGPSTSRAVHGALREHNILLITIDTLRADRVGAYGSGGLTPVIDRLAASGIRFSRAFAHAPLTLPAHTSIFTGLTPATHGVHTNGAAGVEARVPTLAERLRAAGYRTAAFVGAFVLDARFGLNRGFDVYDDHVGSGGGPIDFAFAERPADRVAKAAGDWILGAASPPSPVPRPWFAWVHLFDPHAPYHAPEQRAAEPYDNEVAFADSQLGVLLERLRAAGQLDRTLVVVLADHGESLGEHGESTHGLFAYNSTLRIPLVIAGPSLGHQVVDAPAAQMDVMPTVLDLAGLDATAPLEGVSLLGAIRGDPFPSRPIYFEALDAYFTRNWAPLTGVVDGDWKYVDLPEAELYDLAHDPDETRNVVARDMPRTADLQLALERWKPKGNPVVRPSPLDPDAAARLRALGYAAVQPSVPTGRRFTVADDPKRLLDLDRRYTQALVLTGERQYAEAVRLLQSVIAERPDFALAYTNLASVWIESRHPRDAVALLEAARRQGLTTPEISARLGAAYLAAGDPHGAVRVLEPLAARPDAPLEALNTLAIALSGLGRFDLARPWLMQVLARSPGSATTWNNLGLLEMGARRPREAAAAFERAVDADLGLAQAWQGLGAARAASNPDGAIAAWQRAAALRPADYDLLFNLAVLLHERGRTQEARPYIERFVATAPPSQYAADIATLRGWLRP
jgi:arylsulfatase A-like enzyme/Flp pilus assembly protein TadD